MAAATDTTKRRGPLFWVLTGGVAFLVLLFGGLILSAYISVHYLRNSSDPDLANMRRMIAPDEQILEENPEQHIIHIRNKKTGAELLMTLDPASHQIKRVPFKAEQPAQAPSK